MANSTDNVDDGWSEDLFIADDRFLKYFNNRKFSDVTFIVGVDRKRIPGHKLILSQSCYEFYNVFSNIKLDNDELLIEDATEEAFLCFLKFCYTGNVDLDVDGIDGLAVLKVAYHFKMKPLIEKCETHLCEVVNGDNCLGFYAKSSFLSQDSKLKEKILKRLQHNFEWLTWEKDHKEIFNNLPLESLKEIADLKNFDCDEMKIFNGILNWAKFNCEKKNISCEPENLRLILGDVFYKIRFPIMKLEWFTEIILQYPTLFKTEEIFEILKDIKSDEKTNSKFSHDLRNRGYAYVVNPLSFDWGVTGNMRRCFPGPFQLRNDSSSEMSISFKSISSRCLLGFAFISKRKQTQKIKTCQLKKDVFFANYVQMETEIKHNWDLSWDYQVTVVAFKHKLDLEKQQWYDLFCKIDCDMVNIKLDPPYSQNDFWSEGVFIRKGEYNIIPYLLFE